MTDFGRAPAGRIEGYERQQRDIAAVRGALVLDWGAGRSTVLRLAYVSMMMLFSSIQR